MIPEPRLTRWGVPSATPFMDYIAKMTKDKKKKAVITLEDGSVLEGYYAFGTGFADLIDGREDVPVFQLYLDDTEEDMMEIPECMIADVEIVDV